nr:reverse transcriptase domain-containing protein [Tanacetum cinerariifolium]
MITFVDAARRWLEKEPPHSILTWEDLVSKFINEFFPSSRTTNLRNEIFNFQQQFDESFHEACDRYKDLLRACPHYGFTELHKLDTFYNALNPADQDSLNAATGGNLLERRTQDVLTIIENKSTFQATPPPASVKTIEEICVTCGGVHPYYQCLAADSNTFPELRDNIQGYVAAVAVNYNQGPGSLPSNTVANPKGELKAITTRSGIVLDGPFVPIPPPFINQEEDERPPSQRDFVMHQMDPLHPNIHYPSRMLKQKQQEKDEVQIYKFWQMFKQLHINITLADALILMPKYQKMLKALLSNKEKLQELANTPLNENCSAVILKKLPKKLGDPGKFLISCGFNELKCKALADLGASINLMPLYVWKKLGLPELISIPDFVIVNYEIDPRVPLILGRPFLRTVRALIDVHGEEMILRDGDERLTLNMRHDTSSYSNQPQKESINLINVFNDSSEEFLEDLFSTNQPSGNSTFPSLPILTSLEVKDDIFDPEGGNFLPEKLLDLNYTKDLHTPLHFDIKSDFKDIEYLLHHDPIKDIYSSLKDSIDQSNLADLNDNLVDSMPEMFTDEHALDYSSPLLFDEYDDDLFEVESDTKNVYNDPFDSKGEKIKESKLLIYELDLPCDFLLHFEYDSILSEDFPRVDALPVTNNEDKVFNPGILIQENLFEVITHVAPEKKDKKLAISNASLVIEDVDPPLYELPFVKEVPRKPKSFLNQRSVSPNTSLCGCQKLGHLAARLGCAETKVVTWDDLAFKLITLGWNVKHEILQNVDPRLKFEFSTFTLNE